MKYCQVEIPVYRVLPIRRVDPGTVLEQPAFNNKGQVVAEPGRRLDESVIRKLKNLDVRKVVVGEQQIRWLPQETVDALSERVSVLQVREFEDASEDILETLQDTESISRMKTIARHFCQSARETGDLQGAEQLQELIEKAESLEQRIEDLSARLDRVDEPRARRRIMQALEGHIRQLEQAFLRIAAPRKILRDTIQTVEEREDLRHSLIDLVAKRPQLVPPSGKQETGEEPSDSESTVSVQMDRFQSALKLIQSGAVREGIRRLLESTPEPFELSEEEKRTLNELRERLSSEQSREQRLREDLPAELPDLKARRRLLRVLDGRNEIEFKELLRLGCSREFARRLRQFNKFRRSTRKQLWSCLNDMTDQRLGDRLQRDQFLDQTIRKDPGESLRTAAANSPGEMTGSITPTQLFELLGLIAKEKVQEALETMEERLEEMGSFSEDRARFKILRENLDELHHRKQNLREECHSRVEDPSVRETLHSWLDDPNARYDPYDLMSMEAPAELLDRVGELLSREANLHRDLWERIDQISGGVLSGNDPATPYARTLRQKKERALEELRIRDGLESSEETIPSYKQRLKQEEPDELASSIPPDSSLIRVASQQLVELPPLTGEQEMLLEPMAREVRRAFFGDGLDRAILSDVVQTGRDLLLDHDHPLGLLVLPASGDRYLLAHALNTSLIGLWIGYRFELSEDELVHLVSASLCQDLGMMDLPPRFWLTGEELTNRALREIETHPRRSREILESAPSVEEDVLELVYQHHERMNGEGYPEGLDESEVHPLTPILSAADVYTALQEPRTYRSARSPDAALLHLIQNSDRFLPVVVKTMAETLGLYPNGTTVELSDGRLGKVIDQNPSHPGTPRVKILTDSEGQRLSSPSTLDLSGRDSLRVRTVIRT